MSLEVNNVYLGDCLEKMKEIDDKSIDLICVDLPFATTNASWDRMIPLNELWVQYERILKDRKPIVLFAAQPFTSKLIVSNPNWYKYSWIWKKNKSTGFLNAKHQPLRNTEDIVVFSSGKTVYNPQMRKGKEHIRGGKSKNTGGEIYNNFSNRTETVSDEYYPETVLEFNSESKPVHPTQKPIALMEYLIKTYSNEGDLILDCCAGSGSTLVAAKNLNRRYIGVEKEENYYNICKERLK